MKMKWANNCGQMLPTRIGVCVCVDFFVCGGYVACTRKNRCSCVYVRDKLVRMRLKSK
jgi:hypothetical protein